MTVAIVADTGPLNYLIQIGEIDLLPSLFGVVELPEVVAQELAHPMAPRAVRQWVGSPPAWAIIHKSVLPLNEFSSLDAGERATITLAEALAAPMVLMDDRRGVAVALARGFKNIGTVGVLYRASLRGSLELKDALNRLQATNFRAAPGLFESVLSRAARTGG